MEELKNLQNKTADRLTVVLQSHCVTLIKLLIAVWVLSCDSLSLLHTGYVTDVPVFKYIFTVLDSMDGGGIETVFIGIGLIYVFFCVRDRQRNTAISLLSLFFSISTVIGISYLKSDSWNYIFLFGTQFILAVFVTAGYYFLYKNSILFIIRFFERRKHLLRTGTVGRFEKCVFEKHSFLAPLAILIICGLPWIIFYFPGTLQWDAHGQLRMYLGGTEKTGHFPLAATQFMGCCLSIGRVVFHSDAAGIFIYTGLQFVLQCLVVSYVCDLMKRLGMPVVIRYFNLFFWAVYPYFPIWGFTMVKDSMHYIAFLLMSAAMADIVSDREERPYKYKTILLVAGAVLLTAFRNDGRYVVVITMICAMCFYRKYWKNFAMALFGCVFLITMFDGVYAHTNNIKKGSVGEMLSIPLQQTARYLREHYDDITENENTILEEGFESSLTTIAGIYNPCISDPVKANFVKYPDREYLMSYFKVWAAQLIRHPGTYIQAFLNHTYGYFYPDIHNFGDYLVYLYIGNTDKWHDGYLDIEFGIENGYGRSVLAHYIYLVEKLPVLSMLMSPGMYTYILFGGLVYLFVNKRREIVLLIPGLLTFLICILSPVNGYLRYVMPNMSVMPLYIGLCYASTHWSKNAKYVGAGNVSIGRASTEDVTEDSAAGIGIDKILTVIKWFVALWVISADSLSVLVSGYVMDVPVLKIFFTVLESMDGWGVRGIFAGIGLGAVFYKTYGMRKGRAVSILSFIFALCTVIGISYSKTDSLDCIFLFGTQFVLAVMFIAGYYFLYKNCILFIIHIVEKNKGLFRTEP